LFTFERTCDIVSSTISAVRSRSSMPFFWICILVSFPDCGASKSIVTAPTRPPTNMPTKRFRGLVWYLYSWFLVDHFFSLLINNDRSHFQGGLGVEYAGLKAFDRNLFVSQTTEINACILLLFFRQLDETASQFRECCISGKMLSKICRLAKKPLFC